MGGQEEKIKSPHCCHCKLPRYVTENESQVLGPMTSIHVKHYNHDYEESEDPALTSLYLDNRHDDVKKSNDVALRRCEKKVFSNNEVNDNFYYDVSLAQKCHKLLNHQTKKESCNRILLYPEEEWARNALGIQWKLKMNRWWKRYCTVTECQLGGTRTISALGKIIENNDGTLTVIGRFKRLQDPDFRLHLSSRLSREDYERGYLMTGALQLGDLKGEGRLEITHFAVIPRYQQP